MRTKKPRLTARQLLQGMEGILIIAACYLTFFLKPLRDRWGLSREEAGCALPGDELVKEPKTQFTHAVIIGAPPGYVWPWIAQLGYGRGGFYSYEALEDLIGLDIRNSDTIIPEFQQPETGDVIPFGPQEAYPLVICEPGRDMAIENWYDLDTKKQYDPEIRSPKNYLHLTWLWHLEATDTNCTRFISRNRVTYSPSFKTRLFFGRLSEPMVFAMDRKMCLGIKKRAERLYRNSKVLNYQSENGAFK